MPFPLNMPKLSPTMTDGVVAKWHKSEGDYCDADDLVLDIATDKATIEFHAIDPGFLRKILVNEGQKASVGSPLGLLSRDKEEPLPEEMPPQPKPITTRAPVRQKEGRIEEKASRISASPLAKKLAHERGIPLQELAGTGPKGRIMSRDLPMSTQEEVDVPLSPMRRVIAERLTCSKATIPHFYCSITVDATALVALREDLKTAGHALTLNDFVVRASALALIQTPALRHTFDHERQSVRAHPHADIAIAVSVPGGLFTPIIFEAENKSIKALSSEIKQLAERAKSGKLLPHEYSGGVFTISNLGMFGIDEFYPIINPPHAAILGVGAAVDRPCVRNGQVTVGKTLSLCLAADHRILDGVEAASFLKMLKGLLEKPHLLLM